MNFPHKREKLFSIIIATLILLFSPVLAASETTNWKSFLGGAITTLAVHEGSHILAAKSYGADVELDGLSLVYPGFDPTPKQKMRVASAGFQGQWLASELAFHKLSSNKIQENQSKQSFYTGMVAGHVIISAAYIFLKEDERSDIYAMSKASNLSKNEILALLLIPAGLDAARLWMDNPPSWLKNASISSKGLGIAAVWNF